MTSNQPSAGGAPFDYIVVGSGAGGGPLAARLAQAGRRVLVLEAGPDHTEHSGDARDISLVPGLHAVSTEHDALKWPFYVKHYSKPPTGTDPKTTPEGIFYPRSSGVGGCTVHNAMITMAGPDSDWEDLADFLADDSWRANAMRAYFQRMEHNDYHPLPTPSPRGWWGRLFDLVKWVFGRDPDHTRGRHGFNGWLHTSVADVNLALRDKQLLKMIGGSVFQAWRSGLNRGRLFARGVLKKRIAQDLDPNHSRTQAGHPEGLMMVPLAVCGERTTIHQNGETPFVMRGRRSSPREFLHETQRKFPDKLVIRTDAFVTKVLFDDSKPPRAVGVRYLAGNRLYRAHENPNAPPDTPLDVFVKPGGEVILSGGAFNTPQTLMLSGIGDVSHLEKIAKDDADACTLTDRNGKPLTDGDGKPRRIDLPGVGRNLQDRYEVTVISEMRRDFPILNAANFALRDKAGNAISDRHLRQWRAEGTGLYTSNGAVIGLLKRSNPDLPQPDLFIFGIPLPFYGYAPRYSVVEHHNQFTWTILKAHTRNNDGTVELRSTNPLDTPEINFHYFNEVTRPGESANDRDLVALVDGVKFVRGIARHTNWFTKVEEHYPAKERPHPDKSLPPLPAVTDDEQEIKDWIRREAWGHHACGTCRMGPSNDKGAVLDSRFRVRGVDGLRVVDASIFTRIPGYFIVTNIYMASEKAADVILEDERYGGPDTAAYPRALREREAEAVALRRKAADAQASAIAPSDRSREEAWPDDVVGLALSGGGVRSATFNLGVLQAMARAQWLRRVDILSTVSGGGYIGAFLGRWYDRLRRQAQASEPAPVRVERELTDPDSPAVSWLRKNGNYLAAGGVGDAAYNTASFLRGFLSVHFVVGLLLFSIFGAINGVRYGLLEPGTAVAGFLGISPTDFPIGHLLEAVLGVFYSPWFIAFEMILLFMVVPRIIAYWIVSQDHHKRFDPVPLCAMLVGSGAVLYAAVGETFSLPLLLIGLAPLIALFHVSMAWRRGRVREEAIGRGNVETQRLRTRNYLTDDLGTALVLAGGALAFAVVDTAGHGLQQYAAKNQTYLKAFAAFGVALAGLMPVVRWIATLMAGDKGPGSLSAIVRYARKQVLAGLLAAALFLIPLVFVSFTAHAAYQGGLALCYGLMATAVAFILSVIFTHPAALVFVNRSSLTQTYAAKLARAYLGATNPLRHRPEAANISEVAAGDDVASIRNYTPHVAGGPLHLINLTVNQTVDFTSQRGNRDRKGESVCVSSIGMSIGKTSHAAWSDPKDGDLARKQPTAVTPLGYVPGTDHPLVDEAGTPTQRAEMLSLRQWMAISGAAFGPARGQSTSLGSALMFGLANLRTGYWWNSGIGEVGRDGYPALTVLRRSFYLTHFLFQTHALLLSEWIARFPGPWDRYWYLSDGGHFEVLGAYELVRRRVPRIIVCDGSADPDYQMSGIANLIRKARIDFAAEIVPFEPADYAKLPESAQACLGTLDQIKPRAGQPGASRPVKCATLFWVRYAKAPAQRSVMLYLKANVTGDESADILQYQRTHPDFPNEPTEDQFFDEEQWESYRRLGEHIMTSLCDRDFWFWKI